MLRFLAFGWILSLTWGLLVLTPLWCAQKVPDASKLRINGERLLQRLERLAEFGATPSGGVNRVAFSEQDIAARKYLIELMQEAGLDVRVDAVGNIIGRKPGQTPGLPVIACGSHADTVPQGGKYDGALGVIAALECAQILRDHGFRTRHPLEVIVFVDEEGGLIGSRALAGEITDTALEIVSHSGKTVRDGIISLGGDPNHLDEAARRKGEIKAFIEIHVEQGKVLESRGIDIGIVEGIVGINWWDVTVEGAANHAGTTPMDMRQDALLAASHFIIAVHQIVRSEPGRQVGTVGRIHAEPGAPNVIPGRVRLSLELRDLSPEKIMRIFRRIKAQATQIASHTDTKFSFSSIDATAVRAPTHPHIRDLIEMSARELGLSHLRMPSGAGHDAQEMARLAPIGMIFVPSVGGISHSPKEFTRASDLVNGANVLLQTLLKIDQSPSLADAHNH
jgi:N-carbamoyl-L-amino-acid hydrolase